MKKLIIILLLCSYSLLHATVQQEPDVYTILTDAQNNMGCYFDVLRYYRHAEEYKKIYAARNTSLLSDEEAIAWDANPDKERTAKEENALRKQIRTNGINPNYFETAIAWHKKHIDVTKKIENDIPAENYGIHTEISNLFESPVVIEASRENLPIPSAQQIKDAINAIKKIEALDKKEVLNKKGEKATLFDAQYDYEVDLQNLLLEQEFWKNHQLQPQENLTEAEIKAWDAAHTTQKQPYNNGMAENVRRKQIRDICARKANLDEEIKKAENELNDFHNEHGTKSPFALTAQDQKTNKVLTFITNHPYLTLNTLAIPSIAIIAQKIYTTHCNEMTQKNKKPMTLKNFILYTLKNPKKHLVLASAMYGTIAANGALFAYNMLNK